MALPKLKRKRSKPTSSVRIILLACIVSLCISFFLVEFTGKNGDTIDTQQGKVQQLSNTDSIAKSSLHRDDGDDGDEIKKVHSMVEESVAKVPTKKLMEPASSNTTGTLPKTITMKTSEGDIRIKLRPDLSLASSQYIQKLLESPMPCENCRFYRAEKPGILQGIITKKGVSANTVLGSCPDECKDKKHDCPAHDPNCGCHGPIMKQGMLGWAAGKGGPDFFINSYKRDATWWNTDHTVWGELADKESLNVVMSFYELPATRKTLTYLDKPVHFTLTTP